MPRAVAIAKHATGALEPIQELRGWNWTEFGVAEQDLRLFSWWRDSSYGPIQEGT